MDTTSTRTESVETVIVGGGQAGLSIGRLLTSRGHDVVILDASARTGDTWRSRWDSLRLFTPARYDGLVDMPFPAPPDYFPTKDEMADFLQSYAEHFDLPVRNGVRVQHLTRRGDRFVLTTDAGTIAADNVVVAMANYQRPRIPSFAAELDPRIVQLHSVGYRNPAQLQDGPVLLVGAGNSSAEIAMEVGGTHEVWMAGRAVGHIPFRIEKFLGRRVLSRLVLRVLFHRVLTVHTPMGRKVRPKVLSRGGPLIRTKPKDLAALGVRRVGRIVGVQDGLPLLDDGATVEVANVIWCTGFHTGFDWIDLPVHGDHEPLHTEGVSVEPGLYFLGLHFLSSLSSGMIHGVERDARRIADHITARRAQAPAPAGASSREVAAWLPQGTDTARG